MVGLDSSDLDAANRELLALREQQRALAGVLRAGARSEGLQPVVDEVVEAAARLCSASNGRVWLLKDRKPQVVANYGDREAYDY